MTAWLHGVLHSAQRCRGAAPAAGWQLGLDQAPVSSHGTPGRNKAQTASVVQWWAAAQHDNVIPAPGSGDNLTVEGEQAGRTGECGGLE